MEIYPAVDLYEGKVVRLERGDYGKRKIYSEDPPSIAKQWARAGARWLHVVDLEGARSGEVKAWETLQTIVSLREISVQFGGGIREREDVDRALKLGVQRVILGTKVLHPSFLAEVTQSYGSRVALSLDLREEEVQLEGWLKAGGKSVFDLFLELERYRVACLIVTDIERDGTLRGPNLPKIKRLLEKTPFPLILSGGVSSLNDLRSLRALKAHQLSGVIIGKALYEGRVDLREALELMSQKEQKEGL